LHVDACLEARDLGDDVVLSRFLLFVKLGAEWQLNPVFHCVARESPPLDAVALHIPVIDPLDAHQEMSLAVEVQGAVLAVFKRVVQDVVVGAPGEQAEAGGPGQRLAQVFVRQKLELFAPPPLRVLHRLRLGTPRRNLDPVGRTDDRKPRVGLLPVLDRLRLQRVEGGGVHERLLERVILRGPRSGRVALEAIDPLHRETQVVGSVEELGTSVGRDRTIEHPLGADEILVSGRISRLAGRKHRAGDDERRGENSGGPPSRLLQSRLHAMVVGTSSLYENCLDQVNVQSRKRQNSNRARDDRRAR
jgi:hypothetical protein